MVKVPADWKPLQLKDIGTIQMCRRIFQSQTKKSGGVPFFKISTFGKHADSYISRELFEKYKKLYPYPEKDDVLISTAGTIGRVAIFDGKDSYFQDSNIVWLTVNTNVISRSFLWWFYRSFPWQGLEGTTIQRLYNKIILNTEIHLPSMKEQQAIADTLSTFDTYISDLTELIEKKRAIRDGTLEDLVSGKKRLDGFSRKWKTYPFSELFNLVSNNTLSRDKLSDRGVIGNIHYGDVLIKYTDVLTDEDRIPRVKDGICVDRNNLLRVNDVVLADTAEDETVGKVTQIGCVSIPLVGGLHTVICRPVVATAIGYLGYYMNSKGYHEQLIPYVTGIKVSAISKKSLKCTALTIPTDIKEQQAIADTLAAMDDEIRELEEERSKMKEIREGAMDDLLTGRVRLPL